MCPHVQGCGYGLNKDKLSISCKLQLFGIYMHIPLAPLYIYIEREREGEKEADILFYNNKQKLVVIYRSRPRPDSLHGTSDRITYLLTEWFIELHFAAKNYIFARARI